MEKKLLHNIIRDVLLKSKAPLSVRQIHTIIEKGKLWYRPSDNQLPKVEQISARVNNYKHLFLRENGVVYLVDYNKSTKAENRLLRLTWNTNSWVVPCGHKWKKSNQGKTNVAHENQFGFGGEEWLFNPRYEINGFRYGFIRGAEGLSKLKMVDKVILFTINQNTSERFLIGEINQLEIIVNNETALKAAEDLMDKYYSVMRKELKMVDADLNGFHKQGFLANVRFKVNNINLYNKLLPVPNLSKEKYRRFIPYKIYGGLEQTIDSYLSESKFIFRNGIASTTTKYSKTSKKSIKTVERIHSEITNDLIEFLKPSYSVEKKNISVEKTSFGNNIADIVLKHTKDNISIIEVKTSDNVRRNIREALGQLLDYALWHSEIQVLELIIVVPNILNEREISLFEKIRSLVGLKLSLWRWDGSAINFNDKIVKVVK